MTANSMMRYQSDLTAQQFDKIRALVYRSSGISLKEGKEALVRSRLLKRLRALKIDSFNDYMAYIDHEDGKEELFHLVDIMTTNKTDFFREPAHFKFLSDKVLPGFSARRMRLWTAACSSGEEPYTLAMVLRENIADIDQRDVRILATDISNRMLEKAGRGEYSKENLGGIPSPLVQKYFTRKATGTVAGYRVNPSIRKMVHVNWLNLIGNWPMRGPFDIIFCRNVMIYFDQQTQDRLINRFWEKLSPGGYLFVGHSEGLSRITHKFTYIQPAVYRK